MYKKLLIFVVMIFLLSGCSLFKKSKPTELDRKYLEKGWKYYHDRGGGYHIYYPPQWQLVKGGRDFIQVYNFDPQKIIPAQRFSGKMVKTEIYWQELHDYELDYYPEIKKVSPNTYILKKTRFTIDLNGLHAERWTGKDILFKSKKLFVYDPNAVQKTDVTTEIVTQNRLYMIVTFTSGDKTRVPLEDIIFLHDSFSFGK